jgi:hypothetical protein
VVSVDEAELCAPYRARLAHRLPRPTLEIAFVSFQPLMSCDFWLACFEGPGRNGRHLPTALDVDNWREEVDEVAVRVAKQR